MKVYFHTFGCKANQYDTELVRQAVTDAGATPVEDPAKADVSIINTCTVTHVGEAKMRRLVRRVHRDKPDAQTVLMGCAAAVDQGRLASLPGVKDVVPGANIQRVLRSVGIEHGPRPALLRSFQRGSRAWLRIQDGCDEHCTFCATTVARGSNRSRPSEEILREAAQLAESHEEIVLTGIHIGTYGQDLDNGMTLSGLVEYLIDSLPRVRIRLSSVEATEVDERLEEIMVGSPDRLAPHLHAPLQSGSDRVLKRMGRHWYSASEYRERIERLASRLPALGLGADVMVGFPGETDEDQARTEALVRALPFTYLHVFPYSERPTASSARLGPPVDPQLASARSAALRNIARRKQAEYRSRRIHGGADVVLTTKRHGRLEGITGDFLTVYLERVPISQRFDADLHLRGDQLVAEPRAA